MFHGDNVADWLFVQIENIKFSKGSPPLKRGIFGHYDILCNNTINIEEYYRLEGGVSPAILLLPNSGADASFQAARFLDTVFDAPF